MRLLYIMNIANSIAKRERQAESILHYYSTKISESYQSTKENLSKQIHKLMSVDSTFSLLYDFLLLYIKGRINNNIGKENYHENGIDGQEKNKFCKSFITYVTKILSSYRYGYGSGHDIEKIKKERQLKIGENNAQFKKIIQNKIFQSNKSKDIDSLKKKIKNNGLELTKTQNLLIKNKERKLSEKEDLLKKTIKQNFKNKISKLTEKFNIKKCKYSGDDYLHFFIYSIMKFDDDNPINEKFSPYVLSYIIYQIKNDKKFYDSLQMLLIIIDSLISHGAKTNYGYEYGYKGYGKSNITTFKKLFKYKWNYLIYQMKAVELRETTKIDSNIIDILSYLIIITAHVNNRYLSLKDIYIIKQIIIYIVVENHAKYIKKGIPNVNKITKTAYVLKSLDPPTDKDIKNNYLIWRNKTADNIVVL